MECWVTNLPVTVLRAPKVGAGMMEEDWGYWMATGEEDSSDKDDSLSTEGFDVWMVFSDCSLIGNTTWTTSHCVK